MRKKISILAVIVLVAACVATLVACNFNGGGQTGGGQTGGGTTDFDGVCMHIDANGDKVCDKCYRDMDGYCVHIDDDNDGLCDKCTQNVVVQVDFYAMNDLHGMYADTSTQPGVDELTTYLKNKQESGHTVVLSSGDMWQGSSESNNTKGKLATEWLNYIDCAAMTLGNHEFDWKTDKIKTNAQLANFPFLAINVYERATNRIAPYCQPSIIVKKGGAKIGIIGAIGDCYSSISSSMCQDVFFKTGSQLTALIKAESAKLKKQGADYIVLSIHDGYGESTSSMRSVRDKDLTWYDASLSNGYIDVVFEGHTHQSYVLVDTYGVKHIQAGGYNDAISHAGVTVNFANGNKSTTANVVSNYEYSTVESDSIINDLVNKYRSEIGYPDTVVGYNGSYRRYDALRTLMAKAYLLKGQKTWGDEYDIVLAGGYLKPRDPYNLPSGNVTIRQIQSLFPFDNEMHLCSIKGSDLLDRYFNNSSYVYARGTKASTIETNLKNGVGLDETYYIVTDSYNTDYAANRLTVVKTLGTTAYPRDCFIEYIQAGKDGFKALDCTHVDANTDGKCDKCGKTIGECSHVDADTNGVCDKCGKTIGECSHVDADKNGKCDKCGATVEVVCDKHIDEDGNGVCDECGKTFVCANHVDNNGDYKCDECSAHIHADANTDGKCDDCNVKYTDCTHVDADTNGVCDKCGETVGECSHVDADKNGVCDKCGATVEVVCDKHIDEDGNGVCDECGKTFVCANHVDNNGDYKCDECSAHIHADANTDGKCDDCNEKYTDCSHVDADTNGICDKCGEIIGECSHVDADKNGECDKCGATVEVVCDKHIDEDGNGVCDNCSVTFVCVHADANNDDICDECRRNLIVVFTFFAINDLHGMYADTSTQPGVDELTTYLLNAQNSGYSLVLSSGDMWQGSTESNNTKGKLATEWLNYVNCTSMTLGNHEFDWKTDKIKTNAQLANFPFLAINVYDNSTNQRVSYCQPSTVVTMGGIKIGIIGAIGDCYSSISASMCSDVNFKTGSALTALVKAEATRLRNEEGVNYIIYSIHDGYSGSSSSLQDISDSAMSDWYDASLSNGYVDVVFEGHTHCSYTLKDSYGVYHAQGGGYNDGISQATLSYNILTGQKVTTVSIIANSVYKTEQSDDIINRLIEKYADEIGDPNEVVGYNDTYRDSSALTAAMAKAYLMKGQSVWGADYDIVLAGGYLNVRDPYCLPVGNVTVGQIQTLFPFDNEMQLCSIKGSDLLSRYFNNSSYVYARGTNASTIEANLRSGSGLNDTYYIVTDSYNSDYTKNNLTVVKTLGTTAYPRDCIIEYIKAGKFGTQCSGHVDADSDGICDKCSKSFTCANHVDTDGDYKCDQCSAHIHADANSDGKCDDCGAAVSNHTCADADGDYKCDECSEYMPNVYTVSKALALASTLGSGESTESIIVVGKIKSISNTTYGNCYIEDDEGNQLFVYGIYDESGSKYNALSYQPQVGDTIVMYGSILYYNGTTLELNKGVLKWCSGNA